MDDLEIDEEIRLLIGQLWKHSYKTDKSCAGHGLEAYVLLTGGDGWFEQNAGRYGLTKIDNGDCCCEEFEAEIKKYGLDPKSVIDRRKSCGCGAGVNGYSVYRGALSGVK